jgi:hypothetical protein
MSSMYNVGCPICEKGECETFVQLSYGWTVALVCTDCLLRAFRLLGVETRDDSDGEGI